MVALVQLTINLLVNAKEKYYVYYHIVCKITNSILNL